MSLSSNWGNKVNFTSLGCPRNLVDTEVMLGILMKAGYEVTEEIEEADYLVINTCAFLESSREESTQAISDLMRLKKEKAKLIVTGCMVTKHRKEIEETFPGVHYLLGSGDMEGILAAVQSDTKGHSVGPAKSYLEQGEIPRQISTPKHYAYLKIAEGCRKACAYCIIPQIKGPLRSKPEEQILKEFKALLSQGVKEIILIAQDLGDYGKDHGVKEGKIVPLLRTLLSVPGDYWLRLLYLYPDEISNEMIELMKTDPRLCPYLDMPIQHINNNLLKEMRRQTSGEQIHSLINRLHQEIPSIHIRTSLIVGFPGETEAQFEELATFLKKAKLHHVGIFKYSQEPGTPAGKREDQIPEEIKEVRYQKLALIQEKNCARLNKELLGKKIEVIVEGYHPETTFLMSGRHQGQCPDIDGHVIINDGRKVTSFGERYFVEITDYAGVDLIGRVVAPVHTKPPSVTKKVHRKKNSLSVISS